jgi:HEAT repeat protein/tRNA A-37 threonylcarbamoyl transferase component Bud32
MSLWTRLTAARRAGRLKHARELAPRELEALQTRLEATGSGAVPALLECLGHAEARGPALDVLARLLDEDSLPLYLEALASPNPAVVSGAARVLERSANYDPLALLPLFEDARTSKRTLEAILAARASSLSAARLLALFPEQGSETRGVVARLLDATVDAATVPDLVRALDDPQWWVRLQAARLLARFPESAAALARRIGDEHRSVRLEVVHGLRLARACSEVPALLTALRDRDLKIQTAAIDAVVALGDASTVPSLLDLLADENEHVRRAAVEVLNALATPAAVQDLARALRDADWWVRVRAADALGTLGGERVVEAVMGLLDEADESLRRYAVEILNAVPSERAVPLLIRAVEDADWWVRERAIDALAKTKDPRAVEPLLALVGRDNATTALCARALGVFADPRAMESLRALAASSDPEIAREARAALHETAPAAAQVTAPVAPTDFRALPPGAELLERYRIVKRIGRGGFGAIYLTEDLAIGERIILKVLNPRLDEDPTAVQRFVQEVKLTRRIAHPNVIRVFDLVDLGGAHAVSMEYFPGRDLAKVLTADGALDIERALRLALQVCEGLGAAHAEGVIHRDIKPDNILVGDGDAVKIVDFGLAWAGQNLGSRLTQHGVTVGTPEYMAPEQIRGDAVDQRADLYALGVLLYEMLTGQVPYASDAAVTVLFKHLAGEPRRPSDLRAEIPEVVEAMVRHAMALDPADRPQSAEAFRREILDLLARPGKAA